jgi:hypothetical protein
MSTEPQRTCSICGNEIFGTMEFCPVCMLRKGLADGVESGESSFEERVRPTPDRAPKRFEHYELVTDKDGQPLELGRCAMGVTYKAVDIDLHCSVTLKVISEKYLGDESARLRFLREARAAASVRHPNVASVLHLPSHPEDVDTPVVGCLCYKGGAEWHLGEIASCHATMDEAISVAKELKDTHALALALGWAARQAFNERNPAEVDRWASELIELSTRHNFVYWLASGAIWRGWARSASGNTTEGIPWIEQGIRDFRATGTTPQMPIWLALKAEALHLADRTSEALEAIREAEGFVEKFEVRWWSVELHRLRAVFLTAMGAEETQIEDSFHNAIRIAKEQKSVSLEKRAEATYAEYRQQRASASGGLEFRLPLG